MDFYNYFINIVDEATPSIPNVIKQSGNNIFTTLYTYYDIKYKNSYSTLEIEKVIHDKMKTLLCEKSDDYELIPKTELIDCRTQIIFEYIVNGKEKEPYYGLISFILDSFRDVKLVIPIKHTEKWKVILKLAKEYFIIKDWNNDNHIYDIKMQQRSIVIGETIVFFKNKYGVEIPFTNGLLKLDTNIQNTIFCNIDKHINNIGGLNLISCLLSMSKPKYNNVLHRFLFTRNFSNMFNTLPDLPIGFLLNISVRYIRNEIKIINVPVNANDIEELLELVRRYCALYDIQSYNQWEDIIIPHEELPKKLLEFALYDSVFNLNQFNPLYLRKFLNTLFSNIDPNNIGYNINFYVNFICDIIEGGADIFKPLIINRNNIYKKYKHTLTTRIDTILSYFSHGHNGINEQYKSPFDYQNCNLNDKPLIMIDSDNFLLINSSMCAMAVYESIMSDLRKKMSNIDSDIGLLLEKFIKQFFSDNNINVTSGNYKNFDGDCDIVIESSTSIIFIEVKKKSLTKIAKSGNDIKIFIDLSKSLIDSLLQLNQHEIKLLQNSKLELENDIIEYKNRKIEKISLVLHDFGTIQDKIIFDAILRNMEFGGYDVYDPVKKDEFKQVMEKSNKLKDQIKTLESLNMITLQNPHINCYFLCLDQLLMIISDSDSNESFVTNLQSIRNIALYNHDIYQTYQYRKTLQQHSDSCTT